MRQTVRITGGLYRGKKLFFPDVKGLRPTSSRIKETLFNWLMHDIQGASCLDAFAGSGALGFEAFSRGAKRVVLLESSKEVVASLLKTAKTFNSPALSILHQDALTYLETSKECFDIIFLDPPFSKNYLPKSLALLAESNLLIAGGLVYLESPDKLLLNPVFWTERKSKQTGQVIYGLYEKN